MKTADIQELMETKFPKLDATLLLSKAEGNLKFLASAEMKTFTQGESVRSLASFANCKENNQRATF